LDLSSLKKKYGPLPAWAWALIVSAILYFLYRHFKSSGGSTSTATDTSSPATSGNIVGTPPITDTGPIDTSGDSITPVDTLPNTDVGETTSGGFGSFWVDPTATGQDPKTVDTTASPVPPLSSPPITISPPAATPKPAAKPVATAPLKSIIPGIKGKIISQKVLPSGAKLVTLAGGREIEQAKGKKAYVVRK
jgi:hypothetical protein